MWRWCELEKRRTRKEKKKKTPLENKEPITSPGAHEDDLDLIGFKSSGASRKRFGNKQGQTGTTEGFLSRIYLLVRVTL